MITIDKSIVKVVNSYVKKQFDDLEIVGIECEYVVSLWDENIYNPFKKVNIIIKNDIGFDIDYDIDNDYVLYCITNSIKIFFVIFFSY